MKLLQTEGSSFNLDIKQILAEIYIVFQCLMLAHVSSFKIKITCIFPKEREEKSLADHCKFVPIELIIVSLSSSLIFPMLYKGIWKDLQHKEGFLPILFYFILFHWLVEKYLLAGSFEVSLENIYVNWKKSVLLVKKITKTLN